VPAGKFSGHLSVLSREVERAILLLCRITYPHGGNMETRVIRSIEDRLSRLERYEKARYHRKQVYKQYMLFGILFVSGMLIAAGIGGLVRETTRD